MTRILDIPAEERTEEQARLYKQVVETRGRFFSPYKVWMPSPPIGFGFEIIGGHLKDGTSLSAAEMELAVLVTALHWNAAYVIKNHVAHALKAGLDAAIVEALQSRAAPKFNDPRQKTVYDFAKSALAGETPSDADFTRYETILSRAGIADILGLIGYFTSVSLAMKTHGV